MVLPRLAEVGAAPQDLIRTRVREEVARYNLRPAAVFSGLVQPDGATLTRAGYSMDRPRRIDCQRQADIAIDAFGRNGFFVLIDGRQTPTSMTSSP